MDIDTAHLQIAGLDPAAFIREHADSIGSVHLSDTAFVDDEEAWKSANPEFPRRRATQVFRDIGQGDVDLPAACRALQSIGYTGWLICSCRQTRDPMRALLRTRHHIDQHILAEQ
jgi:inosose dehydratase